MSADKTVKYDPAKSVLNYRLGDKIALTEGDFARICEAFLSEVQAKYV